MRFVCLQISTLFLTSALAVGVQAQNNHLEISFTVAQITSNLNGTLEALVKLKNPTHTAIQGFLELSSNHPEVYLVQRKPRAIRLMANDSLFIVVKAIVSNMVSPDRPIHLNASFTNAATKEEKNASLLVQIREKKAVRMLLPEINSFYERLGDSIQIVIRLLNEGNSPQEVSILSRYTKFITAADFKKITLKVQPFSDTLVVLKQLITRAILAQESFPIAITALYKNGDVIGVANIDAQPIKQSRRYRPSDVLVDNYALSTLNQVAASRQSNNNNDSMYALYGNAQALSGQHQWSANLDANWWPQSKKLFLRNTWLGYKSEVFGLKLGNLAKFNELNFIGRGLESFYQVSDENRIEAGILEKSYSVIDYSSPSLGQSGWLSFIHKGGEEKGYQASFLFDHHRYEKIKRALLTAQGSLINRSNFFLQGGASISQLFAPEKVQKKWGGAAEINFRGKTAQLFYNGSNYISSGHFAGFRTGALNLNESIHLRLKNYSLWASANHFAFHPKAFHPTLYPSSRFSNTQLKLGAYKQFSSVMLSLLATSLLEKRIEPLFFSYEMRQYKMQAHRISLNANYFKRNQNIYLSLEGGLFNTNLTPQQAPQFKANFNYSWKFFNLTAYYQYNNFDLGEIIALGPQNNKTYHHFIVSPSLQADVFRQKIALKGGLMFAQNSFMAKNLQFTGRVDFKVNKNLFLFASNFYSHYAKGFKAANSVQFGLTKHFYPLQLDNSKNDLELYCFYDIRERTALAPKKIPCPNQLLTINGKAFRTNEQGLISYKNLPNGEYEICPINSKEWYAPSRKINLNKSLKIEIGWMKTSVVKGQVKYLSTANSFAIAQKLVGLSLMLTDKLGAVFYTKTDETGKFVFYVPENDYSLTLDPTELSEHVSVIASSTLVKASPEAIQEVVLELQVKEKRIEVKKFGIR